MSQIKTITIIFLLATVVASSSFLSTNMAFAAINTKPTIAITSPSGGASITGPSTGVTINVSGTASDSDNGVKIVEVKTSRTVPATATPKAPGDWSTWTYTLTATQEGSYTVYARATDFSGNQKVTSVKIQVIFADPAPNPTPNPTKPTSINFVVRNNFRDMSSLTTLYQKHARSTDVIAQFTNQLLDSSVTSQIPSQKAVTYFSLADIQNNVATLSANGYTWVIYDLEPSYSPASEVADPVGSVQQASQIIHNAGLKFMLTPALIPISEYGAMAVYTDGFILQAQDLLVKDSATITSKINKVVNIIRTANPSTTIYLQGSLIKDTPEQINAAYDLVKDKIDGITIFYNNDISEIPKIAAVLTHVDGIS